MAKKLGWSFTIDANVEVQQDKLNKASKILESFYDKYEDRSLQVDTSDLIKSVKQGVAVIQDLYADGTKDATSWLNIRPEMKKQMEGILSDAEEMFSNIRVLFNNGERVSGLSNIVNGFNEQLAVSFADINGAYDDLVDKQRNLANALGDFSISDSDDAYDIRSRIDLLEELIEVQKEMATMNPALKTKDLVGRNSVGVLENSLEYYKEALDEMAKYELQTYDQLQKHREIFANLDFDYDDERHEDIKGYEWYDSGIDELETAIENRKTAIELLREYSNDLPVDYDISKYINQAMGDIGRFESYLKELKTLRGDDEPIISGDTFGGNLTEVVEELGKIEQAIRDVLVAFQPLTDALSSEDSAISKFVNSSVEDLNRLQAAFKETFDDIKALSQKEFVNQTIFQGGGKSSGPNKTTQLKSETQELYRQVKLLEKDAYQIVGIFNDNRINLDKVLGISETFKLLEQEDFASKLNSNNYQALNAIMAKLQTAKQELIEFNSLLNTSGLGAKWNADYATKSKYTNRSSVGNRDENVDVDFGNVENKITEFRQNIENELSSVRQRINDIFSFTNLNPDYTAIETITENIYQKFIELQTRINNIEFTIQTPKVVSDTVDTGDASSADTAVTDQTGILAKIKTLSEQIEGELASIRSKIEETFNFATVNPNLGGITEITEKIYQQFVELQANIKRLDFGSDVASKATEGVDQTSGVSSEKLINEIKSLRAQIEPELQTLRQKIEETFDFSTINPSLDNITTIIDKVYRHFEEMQNQINKLEFKIKIATIEDNNESTSGVENATKAIQNEGDAAEDAVPKKNAFVEANEKVAESMRETGDAGKDAVEGIEEEIKAATKASSSLDKVQHVIDADGKPLSKTLTSSEVTDDAIITQQTHFGYDNEKEAYYLNAVSIVEDFKKRAAQLKKDAEKVALAKKTLEKFISQFESKTAGQASTINGFDDLKKFNIKNIDDIEEATRKMIALDNEYNKITKSFRQGTKSMNPFVNAITGINEMSDKIKSAELSFDSLNSKPKELSDKVASLRPLLEKLNSFIAVDKDGKKTITDIYGLAEAYGQLNIALRQVNSSISLQRKEERVKSAASKQEAKRIKELYKLYDQQAESAAKIHTYRQQLKSGDLGKEEARLIAAQLKQEQSRQASIQQQIKGYGDLYNSVDKVAIVMQELYMAELKLNAESEAKERKAKEQELNALYKERGQIITNIIQLTKRLNSLKTAKAKARVKEELDAEEFKLLDLDEQLEQKYGKSLDKSKTDKQDARLIRAGVDVAATKQEASKMRDYNLWFTRRGEAYEHLLTLKKQLAKADGEQEKAAIQKEIKEQEKLIEVLSKKLDKYKDISLQQKTADQEYRYRNKDEWRQSQQEIADAASSDKDQTTKQKQDYEEILMLVQKIFTAKKELSKMNSDTSGAVHTNDIERATNAMNKYVELLKEIFSIDIEQLGATIDQSGLLTQEQKNKLLKEERDYKKEIAKIESRAADKTATREAKQKTGYGKTIYNREAKYFDTIAANERSFADIGLSGDFLAKIEKYKTAFKELQQLREKFANDPSAFDDAGLKNQFQDSALAVEKLRKEILSIFKESRRLADLSDADLLGKTKIDPEQFADAKSAMISFAAELTNGQFKFEGFNASGTEMYGVLQNAAGVVQKVTVALDEGTSSLYAYQTGTNTIASSWGKLKSTLSSGIASIASMYLGIHDIIRIFRQGATYVKEIDLAMTELKKVTNETDETYRNFLKTASNVSSVIGSTVSDFTDATAAFARLGYNISESAKMAETAIVYKNVADGLDSVEESTDSIISTMMAYGIAADDTMAIIDRFNAVGNNFAITSAGIGYAMQRSASALKEGGNTIDESIGLITAANSVIQNPEQVGTALKTLSLRLRGAKVELEEAGLDVENMAESTATLQAKLKALTHGRVDIMLDADTFKSTTQILREMSEAWEHMTDIERASALELMGGKRQANILASVITNFETVEDVITTSMNSSGSAIAENEKWLDSIEGKTYQFTNALETMWSNMLSSDMIKGFLDFGTQVIQFLDTIPGKITAVLAAASGFSKFKGFSILGLGQEAIQTLKSLTAAQSTLQSLGALNLTGATMNPTSIQAYAAAVSNLTAKQQANMLASSGLTKAQIQLAMQYNGLSDDIIREATAHVLVKQAQDQENMSATELLQSKVSLSVANLRLKGDEDSLRAAIWLEAEASKYASAEALKQAIINDTTLTPSARAAALAAIEQSNANIKLGNSFAAMFAANPVGMILTIATTLATVLIPIISKAHKSTEELTKEANEAINVYKETQTTLKQQKATIDDISASYEELSKGVDLNTNENISLSTSSYEEYLNVCNQIADMYPQLVTGYDEQGNAILSLKGNVDQLTQSYREAAQAARQQMIASGDDVFKAFKKNYDHNAQWRYGKSGTKQNIDMAKELLNVISSGTDEEINRFFLNGGDNGLENLLDEIGIDNKEIGFTWLDWFVQPDVDIAALKQQATKITSYIKATTSEVNAETNKIKTLVDAYLGEDKDYQGLSEKSRSFVQQIVSGLNADFVNSFESADALYGWVDSNIVAKFKDSGVVDIINDLSELQNTFKEGDINYKDYSEQLAKSLEQIQDDFDDDTLSQIKLSLGIDEKALKKDKKHIEALLDDTVEDVESKIDSLSVEDLQIAGEFEIPAGSLYTWDELVEKIEKSKSSASSLADEIQRAAAAQSALDKALDNNPNDGYETRGEAMEDMKKMMGRGEIGSESNLWNVAEAYGFTYDSSKNINANADALADFIAIRQKWFKEDSDGNATYQGTESFIKAVEKAVEGSEELQKYMTWTYDNGVFDFDFKNEDWDTIVKLLGETKEVAGLTSSEFADLLVQIGQYFGINWTDSDEALNHLNEIATGASNAKTKVEEYGKVMQQYFGKGDVDLTTQTSSEEGKQPKVFTNTAGTKSVVVTPTLPDGTTLSDEDLESYAKKLLAGKELDPGIDIKLAEFGGKNAEEEANEYLDDLLKALEQYFELQNQLNSDKGKIDSAFSEKGLDGLKEFESLQSAIKEDAKTGWTVVDTDMFASVLEGAGYTKDEINALIKKIKEYENVVTTSGSEDPLGLNSANKSIDTVKASLNTLGVKFTETYGLLGDGKKDIQINVSDFVATLKEKGWSPEQIKEYAAQLSSTEIDGFNIKVSQEEIDAAIAKANEVPETKTTQYTITGTGPSTLTTINDELSKIPATKSTEYTIYEKTIKSVEEADANGTTWWNHLTWFANGTAHSDGTAFSSGSWGAPETETALVGELGPELLVRNGRWTTVGENGAEFTQVRRGDIIFNHKQTEQLLKNGYVTGRGRAYAGGTAFADGGGAFTKYTFDGNMGWSSSTSTSLSNAAESIEDAADKFEEVFDWVEVRLEEINETLDLMNANLENAVGYGAKNEIIDQMIDTNKVLLANTQAGAEEYKRYVDALLQKVPEKYREPAQNGAIAVEEFAGEENEKTLEAINNYREWAQKYAELIQQMEEIETEIASLAKQKFDNVSEQYENELNLIERTNDQLDAQVSLMEDRGYVAAAEYYESMIQNTQQYSEQLELEKQALQNVLDEQVKLGNIKKYSDEWYEMVDAIYEVDASIDDCTASLEEYQNAINDIYWDNFDELINRYDYLADETQNLIDLMENAEEVVADPEKRKYEGGTVEFWTEDDVKWTEEGMASLGLYAQQMEIAEKKAEEYAIAIEDLNEDYQAGKYSETEYLEKLNELKDAQYDSIDAYYEAQDAIKDLNEARIDSIKEGIEKEVEAYEELIDKKKEALDAEKDLYDFQKSVNEQQKDIAKIERQLAALQYDNSLSAIAKRKQLEAELAEANAELEETYYDRSIEDQKNALDKELEDFQEEKDAEIEKWEEYLDNIEQIVADSLTIVQANASGIYDTLSSKAEEYDLTLSEAILTPWQDGALAISDYQETFDTAASSTMDQLDAIKDKWQEVIDKMSEVAGQEIAQQKQENATITAATKSEAKTSTYTSKQSNTYTVKSGDTLWDIATAKLGSGARWQEIYDLNRDIISNPDLIQPGWTLKLPKYAKGTAGVKGNQLAIIDELGLEELVMHADGNGRLAFLSKGSAVIPHDISENLMALGQLDPQDILERSRPVISAPHVTNNNIELNVTFGEVVHIDTVTNDTVPNLSKTVEKQIDKYMKGLNAEIRKFTR